MIGFAKERLRGVVPPLLTPFTGDGGAVDPDGVRRLVEHVVAGGVHALFAAGTTGEFAALGEGDWHLLIDATVRAAGGRVPVLAGVTHNTTAGAIALARAAADLGAAAVVATCPGRLLYLARTLALRVIERQDHAADGVDGLDTRCGSVRLKP